MDFSLDDILSEYRVWPEPEQPDPETDSRPVSVEREPDGVESANLPEDNALREDLRQAFRDETALPGAEPSRPKKPERPAPAREERSSRPDRRPAHPPAGGKKGPRPTPGGKKKKKKKKRPQPQAGFFTASREAVERVRTSVADRPRRPREASRPETPDALPEETGAYPEPEAPAAIPGPEAAPAAGSAPAEHRPRHLKPSIPAEETREENPPAPAAESAPPAEPRPGSQPAPVPPAEPRPPRAVWPDPNAPAQARSISQEDIFSEMFTPEELVPLEVPDGADVTDEGYADDADFYAGPVAEEEPEAPEPEETASPAPESGAREDDRPETPVSRRARRGGQTVRDSGSAVLDRISALLAAASRRREINRSAPEPEPEDLGLEMPPEKAARHYASQLPALRLRSFSAALICLLLIWLTISCRFGAGLPGRLATDIRLASMVALVAQITVLLLGLDVITAGVLSLFRGRPGAESMIAAAMLASTLDIVSVIVTYNGERGLPFVVIPCLAVFFALWGGWQTGAAYHDSFLALFHAGEGSVITTEELPERRGKAIIKSRRDAAGFVRRSEEPSLAETLAESAFWPMAALALALSLALAMGSRDMGAFFHLFGLMTALCVSFGWLFSFPVLFARTARHLLFQGSAVAGWSGVRDTGAARCMVLTDTDVFPEDTVEITGIRLLDKSRAGEIISLAGSMLSTAGTGTALVFTELMRRHNAALQTVEEFAVGEGGCKGRIGGKEIRTGTVGYMHLSGVKIPEKLRTETAIYVAEDGELSGVFLFRYRPMASIQRALWSLRRERRKPIFAVRDFNLDPQLLKKQFGVSTEGFEFPPFAERFRISGVPLVSKSPVNGVMAEDGLETLVDLTESARRLSFFGRICAWACPVCSALGAALMLAPCWTGNWTAASAATVLLYMAVWLAPTLACWLLTRK